MRRIAGFSARHPGPILVFWALAFVAGLLFAGDARDQLRGTDLRIPGTESDRAASLTQREFGSTIGIAILLKGPARLLEDRGPTIVRRLERIDGVEVLSPWAIGGERTLREPSGQALLTLQIARPFQEIADQTTPAVQRVLRSAVRPPLSSEMTGLAPLVKGINDATVESVDKGERIALPVLFLLLLLIFRSPIAALVPAVCGLAVTVMGTAAMGLAGRWVAIDALALNIVTMIGLALGVDYSLLIVSRFREELAGGAAVQDAVELALARAGRTVVFAGTALVAGMLGVLVVAPGGLLVSTTMGVIIATVIAVLAALLLIPAGLAVIGKNVDRWQFSLGGGGSHPWARIARRAIRRPGIATLMVLLPLLLLSSLAFGLNTGPPSVENVPKDNSARKSYEAFQRDRGAGWSTPYEITFSSRGPITTSKRLRALKRFQDRVARRPRVDAVLGPAVLLERTALLRKLARQATSQRELRQLSSGLRRTRDGTGTLRNGLGSAAAGAEALVAGLGQAATGSSRLAGGVRSAAPQTQRLARGVQQTGDGARRVSEGSRSAEAGSVQLERAVAELNRVLAAANASSDTKLNAPLDRAQSLVQSSLRRFAAASPEAAADPAFQRAREDIQSALSELAQLDSNLSGYLSELDANTIASREAARGASRLSAGLGDLAAGSDKLAGGIDRTAAGASQLAGAFTGLDAGTSALSGGLAALLGAQGGGSGARALAAGLNSAFAGSNQLGRGVQRLYDGVVRVQRTNDANAAELRRSGTSVSRASDSGYFVLAGIEGTQRRTQTNVAFAINTSRGGDTARVIVVPSEGPFDPRSVALRPAIERETRAAARQMGATGIVGGPAVLLNDFDRETTRALPYLVLALVLLTFLVLLWAFRSPVLALIAVLLNVVTVGAAVGVLIICFQGDSPLLGGAGYLDAIAVSGILGIIFGLSIDYEVFLISRLLEGRELTGTTQGAIDYGLEKTTTIITGAALIMAGVFLAFAGAPVANIRQFGIGLTVAVLIDATVVRLVLLPALVKLLGERTWYVPRWLGRPVAGV